MEKVSTMDQNQQSEQGGRFPWPITWLDRAQWSSLRQIYEWQLPPQLAAEFEKLDLRSYVPWYVTRQELEIAAEIDAEEEQKLTQEIAKSIQLVKPSVEYRDQLKAALLATHRQDAAQRTLFQSVEDSPYVSWPLIATVPVLLGIAALLWRHTHRSGTDIADAA
jgi:hypothetical protein